MQNDVKVIYDLEITPLQFKTNSEVGSNEEVRVRYFNDQGQKAGGISLHFSSSPKYQLWWCSELTNFPIDLPSAIEKTWTFSVSRTTSVTFVIHCNDKEVLNVVLSDTTCNGDASWSTYYTRKVEKIEFATHNTAADYYRPGEDIFLVRD